jgi:hypothetical protein
VVVFADDPQIAKKVASEIAKNTRDESWKKIRAYPVPKPW